MRPFWMPILLCVGLFAVAVGFAASWRGFDPKHVVVLGNHRVTRHEILARAAVAPQVSIWFQSTGAIARRIEAIPYVAAASVRRAPPASIRIAVSERVPFAVVRSGAAAAVVDRSLRVLEPGTGEGSRPVLVLDPGLELVPGSYVRRPAAIELRDAYEAIAARRIAAVELRLDRFGGLVVTMRSGLRLLLGGESDLDRKLALADAILAQVVTRQARVAAIDLRAPSSPVLVYR